ncbi:MAG: nuclear transport factor 2 family protein [Nitriliruptorales bacterium]|nr:nuclear transport factor 2 family protein [Nitriliruptorales bacterium]
MTHPNEEIARRAFEGFVERDRDAITRYLAEDMTYHLGGDSAISGDREGRDAFLGLIEQANRMGIETSYDLHAVLADDDHAVVLFTAQLEREGKDPYDQPGVFVYHVEDGQITEIWSFPFDQAALKEFAS